MEIRLMSAVRLNSKVEGRKTNTNEQKDTKSLRGTAESGNNSPWVPYEQFFSNYT